MRAPQTGAVVRWVSWSLYHPSFFQLLDEVEWSRAQRYARESDRRRFVLGVVVTKRLVAERYGIPTAAVKITRSCPDCDRQHGRPRLQRFPGAVSVTHTDGWTGVALHRTRAVGLDIEARHAWDLPVLDGMLDVVGTDEERGGFAGLPPREASAVFLRLWTRKEALLKVTGSGLRVPLQDVSVTPLRRDPIVVRPAMRGLIPECLVMAVRAPVHTIASLALSGPEVGAVDVAEVSASWLNAAALGPGCL